MPQLDLSALNGAELRRLLDSVRERGQAAQSYQILEEMARRREDRTGRKRSAVAGEPRIISVDFSDPLEREDEERWEPEATPATDLTLERRPAAPPRRRWGLPVATFTVGAILGVGGGLWIADATRDPPPPPAELAALQAELAPPPPLPQPAAPAEPAPAVETPSEAVAPSVVEEAPAEPSAAEIAEPAPTPEPKPAADPACAGAATPADRVICGDTRLQGLQADLRRAYAEALAAHEDRAILRQRQLAWADARKGVTDPDQLAALYEQRIRKLDAATADARRLR